jgi:uncharacterized protein (UPF0548 family)
MSHGPFWIRRPTPTRLAALLDEQRSAPLSYPDVGATTGHLPSGYHAVREALVLGRGQGVFERAAKGIRAWAPQRAAGIDLVPPKPDLVEGESLLLSFRSFPFHVTAACRVVYVVDEPDRRGFAYGTLPGHPETGEELFSVRYEPATESVYAEVTAFSRHGTWWSRLAGPVTSLVQRAISKRYLRAV